MAKWEDYQTQRDERRQPSKFPAPAGCQADDGLLTAQIKLSKVKLSKDKVADATPIVNNSVEIYAYYAKTIKPGAKEDAIKNIAKLLKTGFSKDDLLGRVNAYAKQLAAAGKQDRQYYIQANNFFGEKARFKDFESLKIVVYSQPKADCKACKGSGRLQNGEGQIQRCYCVKEAKG